MNHLSTFFFNIFNWRIISLHTMPCWFLPYIMFKQLFKHHIQRPVPQTSFPLAAFSNNCKGEIITHLTSSLVLKAEDSCPCCLYGSLIICYNLLLFIYNFKKLKEEVWLLLVEGGCTSLKLRPCSWIGHREVPEFAGSTLHQCVLSLHHFVKCAISLFTPTTVTFLACGFGFLCKGWVCTFFATNAAVIMALGHNTFILSITSCSRHRGQCGESAFIYFYTF